MKKYEKISKNNSNNNNNSKEGSYNDDNASFSKELESLLHKLQAIGCRIRFDSEPNLLLVHTPQSNELDMETVTRWRDLQQLAIAKATALQHAHANLASSAITSEWIQLISVVYITWIVQHK